MNAVNSTLISIILILIVLLFLSFRLSQFLGRRAICQVVTRFRDYFAVSPQKALTLENLGLDFGFRFRILRDYRPWAFETLFRAGVIRSPDQRVYYLSEEAVQEKLNISCGIKLPIK